MTDFANIINVPIPGSARFEQDTTMAIARIRAALGPTGTPTFASLKLDELSGIVKATAGVLAGGGAHADLASVTANQHHNQAHVIDGADHTASGLTTGDVLTATGATTFGFAAPTMGVTKVANEAARLVLDAEAADLVYQVDTGDLYLFRDI